MHICIVASCRLQGAVSLVSKAHVQEEMATSRQIILEDMTTLGICSLLEDEGFPDEVIDSFKGILRLGCFY